MSVAMKFRMNPRIVDRLAESGFIKTVLEVAAQIVETEAKRRAPYKTGNLRRSIGHAVQGRGKDRVAVVAATAFYGGFQEFGTSRTPAHPYLRPALMTLRREAKTKLEIATKSGRFGSL